MEDGALLERLERIVDRAGVAERIEVMLPVGVRPRQLRVRTLLVGMLAVARDGRPAHLRRVHEALTSLPEADRRRLGVIAEWRSGPHQLTYRQVERTFSLVARALAKAEPDGEPSEALGEVLDALLEASVELCGEPETSSYAVDWTDLQTFSCPPPKGGERCGDPDAAWGHRRGDSPGERDESFFGYYLQVVSAVGEERGRAVPELVRRIHLAGCKADPPAALVPVLERMVAAGIQIGDLLADSGYAHRVAETWALPVRHLGASLVQDLHPHDRGPKGTHAGATIANGNLYCPATPAALLELGPLARGATEAETAAHDQKAAELRRHRLAPLTGYDADGYRRLACPAARGKLRCPLRPDSMQLDHTRPEVISPPEHPPTCLLRPEHDHGASLGQRQDRAEARLPLARAPPLLRAAKRRRARLRDSQGPGLQRHLPGLVQARRPRADRAVRRHRLRRPQPARRRRLRRAGSRGRAASRRWAAAQAAQAPPPQRGRADRRGERAALTSPTPRSTTEANRGEAAARCADRGLPGRPRASAPRPAGAPLGGGRSGAGSWLPSAANVNMNGGQR